MLFCTVESAGYPTVLIAQ